MYTTPEFSAFNETTEPDRILRLHAIWGYAIALADRTGGEDLQSKVRRMNDYKGSLTVCWNSPPSSVERDFFLSAWNSSVGDGSKNNVEHVVQADGES